MAEHPRSSKAPITISEYIETQRAHGSCAEELKTSVKKCTKAGFFLGVPTGLWVAYAHEGLKPNYRSIRAFSGRSISVLITSIITFGGLGALIGTYNCLRVVR